jgi:hypothetical protein
VIEEAELDEARDLNEGAKLNEVEVETALEVGEAGADVLKDDSE